MTICRIIGDTTSPTKKPIPIQFIKYSSGILNNDYWMPVDCKPTDWQNIELISGIRNNKQYYDIMFAYDDDRSNGVVILGHWNDGVVEQ
jgi:hypothetical protein